MAVNLSPLGGAGWQFFDNNGIPLAGGLLYTYAAGTSTPIATYTTSAGSVANSNPIVLNSTGRLTNEIWFTTGTSVKIVLQNSLNIQIGSYDNLSGINDFSAIYTALASSTGSSLIGYNQGGSGAVSYTVQSKLQQYLSVKDFGAKGDGTTDDTAAIQAALNTSGSGSTIFFPTGTYYINGTLTKKTGQILQGTGWACNSGFIPSAGTILVQHSTSDINLIQVLGVSDAAQQERGGLRDIALLNNVPSSTVGTAFYATYARQQQLNNVYIASFRTGIYQGPQCWQWNLQSVRVMDFANGLITNSSAEDSVYIDCQFSAYQSSGVCVRMQNQCANNTFITSYFQAANFGIILDQGDTNGNGTGTPYPMHSTFIGCLIEDMLSAAFVTISSNQSASNYLWPGLTLIHTRAFNGGAYATPNNGQSLVYALSASQISVRDTFSNGFSYGATIAKSAYSYTYNSGTVGPILWELDYNSTWGTSRFQGQIGNITQIPGNVQSCSIYSNSLSYTANTYITVPFANVTFDTSSWAYAAGNAIKPTRGNQLIRFYAQLEIPSAPASRYALILYKNGSNYASLDDVTTSSTSTSLTLKGEFWDTPNGTTDTYTIILYANSNCSISAAANNTFFNANLIGN